MSQDAEDKTLKQKENLVAFFNFTKIKKFLYMFLLLFLVVNITNVHCYEVGRYKKKKKHSTFRKLFN